MIDIVIVIACYYLAYSNIRSLMEVPPGGWGLEHTMLAVVTVGLVVVGSWKGIYTYKSRRRAQAEKARAEAEEKRARFLEEYRETYGDAPVEEYHDE